MTDKIFRFDVQLIATAYVRAETAEEAKQAFVDHFEGELQLIPDESDISDKPFDSDSLPDVSLSPAMTVGEILDEPEVVHEPGSNIDDLEMDLRQREREDDPD